MRWQLGASASVAPRPRKERHCAHTDTRWLLCALLSVVALLLFISCSDIGGSDTGVVESEFAVAVYDSAGHLQLVSAIVDKFTELEVKKYDQSPPAEQTCESEGVTCYMFRDDASEILNGVIAVNHSTGADSVNHGNYTPAGLPVGVLFNEEFTPEQIMDLPPGTCPTMENSIEVIFATYTLGQLETCMLLIISDGYKASTVNWAMLKVTDILTGQICTDALGWVDATIDIIDETIATMSGCQVNGAPAGWDGTKSNFADEVNIMRDNGEVLEIVSSHQAGAIDFNIHVSNVRAALLYEQFCDGSEICTTIPQHFLFVGAVACDNTMTTENFKAGAMAEYYVVAYDSEADSGLTCVEDYSMHNAQLYGGTGSSFAAPRVTALAGELKRINPTLNAAQIAQIIKDTATPIPVDLNDDGDMLDVGEGDTNSIFGHGLINATKAKEQAQNFNGL